MKILYGLQVTGNGHISRGLALLPKLRAAGFEVDVIVSGESHLSRERIDELLGVSHFFKGLKLWMAPGGIDYLKTVSSQKLIQLIKDIDFIPNEYDLVVSDYEPVAGWWGYTHDVLTIGIAHQYAFWGDAPRPAFINPQYEFLYRWVAPVHIPLGSHWRPCTNTTLPPIIRTEVLEAEPTTGEHILVYHTAFSEEHLEDFLSDQRFADFNFLIYPNVSGRKSSHANITFKEYSPEGFLDDLVNARAILTAGGYTLLSECLHLGKPVFCVPYKGHYEQYCNAEALIKWKLGNYEKKLETYKVKAWLNSLTPTRKRFPDVAQAITDWVTGGMIDTPYEFVQSVWRHSIRESRDTT